MKEPVFKSIKASGGSSLTPTEPVLGLVGTGRRAYLWIGNDATRDKTCFATITGAARLRKFAKHILKAIPNPHPKSN